MEEVSPRLLKAKDVDGDGSDDDRHDGRVPSLSTLMSCVPSASKEKVLGRNRRGVKSSCSAATSFGEKKQQND